MDSYLDMRKKKEFVVGQLYSINQKNTKKRKINRECYDYVSIHGEDKMNYIICFKLLSDLLALSMLFLLMIIVRLLFSLVGIKKKYIFLTHFFHGRRLY